MKNFFNKYIVLIVEVLFLFAIVAMGYFLIGQYSKYNYLATGYQDWIYQAFRVRSILEHGIVSWDHIWANGINYWRLYQYIPHVTAAVLTIFLKISASQAILISTAFIFISLRVVLYAMLRVFNISAIVALCVTILSFNISQEWAAVKEYTIFFPAVYLLLYLSFYLTKSANKQWILLSAIAGYSWSLHPVLGIVMFGLHFFSLLFYKKLFSKTGLYSAGVSLIAASSFFINYLIVPVKFSNPYLTSVTFAFNAVVGDYYGLSLPIMMLLVLSIGICVLRWKTIPDQPKIILSFCIVYILAVIFATKGYLPGFIYQTQFTRGMYYVGILLIVSFAFVIDRLFVDKKSIKFLTLVAVFLGIVSVNAVQVASDFGSLPTNNVISPVTYFHDKEIKGSVFYSNDSEASYFEPNVRMAGSYNTHLLPSPLSLRFSGLMAEEGAYTGLSEKKMELIKDYLAVEGVEYLVLPTNSRLVEIVTNAPDIFTVVDRLEGNNKSYSIIQNKQPISYAFLVESEDLSNIENVKLSTPTLNADTYTQWDQQVSTYAKLVRSAKIVPVNLEFKDTNILELSSLGSASQFSHPILLIMQNYDSNWVISNPNLKIQPTSINYMKVDLTNFNGTEVTLTNNWPVWYWPLQFLGLGVLLSISTVQFIKHLWKN